MRYVLILLMACGVARGDMRRVLLGMRDARVAGGGAELWTPEDLDGLSGWWDASDSETLGLSSDSITNWLDKSGNNYHLTQTTIHKAPTVVVDGGLQYARFTAISDQAIDRETWVGTNYLSQDTFIVGRINSASEDLARLVTQAKSTGTDYDAGRSYIAFLFRKPTSKLTSYYDGKYIDAAINTNELFIAETRQTSTSTGVAGHVVITVNATTSVSNAVTPSTLWDMQRVRFGAGIGAPTKYFDGYLGEVIVAPTNYGTDDRQKLEGYLAHKWGITANLPSDHPYKSNPPTK